MVPITDSDQKMTNLHVNTGYKNFNQQLFLKLKNLRQSFADQAHIPPFRVFSNQSLREMAQYRPCDPENFINISGVGEYKLKKYGPAFTSEIIKFCEENGIEIKQPNLTQDSKIDSDLEQIYRLNQEILSLNDKLKELTSRKNDLLNHAINSGIKQQGDYLLLSSISSVRQLNLEAFKQLYPQVFMEIGSVKLSDADKILGKAEVTDLCTLKESIKYSVKKMNPDTGMQEKTDE
jgi:ATP-dependent DNA helicase RecQ